jgi:hypothetical protein
MATIREYFDTAASCLTAHQDLELRNPQGGLVTAVTAKKAQDIEGNAKYWYFFVPESAPLNETLEWIFATPQIAKCEFPTDFEKVEITLGFHGYSESSSSHTLVFTKRMFLYLDALLSPTSRAAITTRGLQAGFYVIVRDREYAEKRSATEKPLAFISHDSRDKDSFVRALAMELSKLMCPVWYDEYSLKIGQSLRSSIEKGLKETKKCVVILSPNFFANKGWGKSEFDSIFTREIIQKRNVMLPVC